MVEILLKSPHDLCAILWQQSVSVTRGKGLKRCTCHSNRLIIACGAARLLRIAPLPYVLLLERLGACAHWGWMTHNYHSDRARSHLPSSPAISLTHLVHMTNDKITPNLHPLTKTWLPIAHTLHTVLKAGIHLAKLHETKQTYSERNFFWFFKATLHYVAIYGWFMLYILGWPSEQ